MKVLHILDSLNRGGAEMLELDLCRNAGANGLELIFVATGGGDLEEDLAASGVAYHRLQRRAPIDRRLIRELRQLVLDSKVDIVHSHQAVEGLHAFFATARLPNVKRVL